MCSSVLQIGSMRARLLVAFLPLGLISAVGCDSSKQSAPVAKEEGLGREKLRLSIDSSENVSPIRFSTVTIQSGVAFNYYGGPSPEHYMTEQNGGGVGLLDFDEDGQIDIFFANGSHFQRPGEQVGAHHRLYRGNGQLSYAEVSSAAGLNEFGFGMGCAVGDYNNDGFADLFLAQYGLNRLWRNNGDGTFSDVSKTAGLTDDRWGTSAAFADFDGDGNLDLYVVNYVEWSPSDAPCYTQHQTPIQISCGPIGRPGQPDVLYHNLGDGSFLDVSEQAGIVRPESKGLGLAVADLDGDGLLDIYVANDTTENCLFRNLGEMRFEEVAIASGVGVGADGLAGAGMGVACGDVDNDGRFDLLVTNFDNQVNDLYKNLGPAGFLNANQVFGLDSISRPMLGFGTVFSDFDRDGNLDMFVANGHVWDLTALQLSYAYQMPAQLIRNIEGRRFQDTSTSAGPYFQERWLGRGVAAGDLDGDGDEDLVVTHLDAPAELLRNDTQGGRPACRLRLVGRSASRQALGCRVEVLCAGHKRTYWVPSGGSFQSASDSHLVIICPSSGVIDEVNVHWPGQQAETWRQVTPVPTLTLLQGTGTK